MTVTVSREFRPVVGQIYAALGHDRKISDLAVEAGIPRRTLYSRIASPGSFTLAEWKLIANVLAIPPTDLIRCL
ncbi:hypothetical protein BH09ACT9_BH09ACT9_00050 [soil metagenome]